ncbi:MAG: ATP-binding protein [Spirochaetota bacterium]
MSLRVIIITALLMCPSFLSADPINLNTSDMYVREGFAKSWTQSLPDDGSWTRLEGRRDGKRPVIIPELDFENIPGRTFLSLRTYPAKQYTLVTSFTMTEDAIRSPSVQGILLAHIGENWQVYCNGHLLRDEMFLDKNGDVETTRILRKVLIPINSRYLKPGGNILSIRIAGDPTNRLTGLYRDGPHLVGEILSLDSIRSERITLMLLFLYLGVGLYHVFLFRKRPGERYNLLYGLFSIVLFIYLFSRTYTIFEFVHDTDIILRLEYCSLYLVIPLIGAFFDVLLKGRLSRFTRIYSLFSLLLILFSVVSPIPFINDVLRVWQLSALIPFVFYPVFRIGMPFYGELKRNKSEVADKALLTGFGALKKTLLSSIPGNLVLGISVVMFTAIYDLLDAVFFHEGLVLTRYGFFAFVVGITLILANRFLYIQEMIESLNVDLEKNLDELHQAHAAISLSEERYRIIVDGTSDLVFSLTTEGLIISANRAFLQYTRKSKEEIEKLPLVHLVYDGQDEHGVMRQLVNEKIEECIITRKPVIFKAKLKSRIEGEPQEMQVRLEYVDIGERTEIIGKAIPVIDDALLEYFISERQTFEMGNYLTTAEELSHRLVRNVTKYLDSKETTMLRIALREMIINAIEHGNLGITYEEKTEATMEDDYLTFVAKRQQQPEYRNRKVSIEYQLKPQKVAYKISDEGEGFDHRSIIEMTQDANQLQHAHGRGIMMASNVFDEVTYNRKGNQVLLVKYLQQY